MSSPLYEGDPPGAELGAIWHRNCSKAVFLSTWERFLIDVGRIFDIFRILIDKLAALSVIFLLSYFLFRGVGGMRRTP